MVDLKGQRVLITGVTGFLGANLVRELIRRQAKIHGLVRPAANLWRIAEVVSEIDLHSLDLTDWRGLERVISQVHPEIIFHLAAISGHHLTREERREALQTNVMGTFNLLEATASENYQIFIHIGSSLEYGPKSKPLQEFDLLEPSTFRGVAKASATLICLQFARANRLPVVVLRPFSIYGPWEQATRLIPTAILSILQGQEISLTAPGFRHDFIYVEDVLNACLLALQAENIAGEVINIGSGRQWSNEQVVEIIQAVAGKKISTRIGDYPHCPSDTTHWVANIEKAKRLLKWEPQYTFQQGLKETYDWFRAHLPIYQKLDKNDQ